VWARKALNNSPRHEALKRVITQKMARTFSTVTLAGLLVIGLVVGAAIGYYSSGMTRPSMTVTSVSTFAVTTTVMSTVAVQSSTSQGTSSASQSNLSAAQIEAALLAASNATLWASSYDYGKGTLDAWIQNNASSAIILTPSECLLNGTLQKITFFTVLDPKVIHFGVYYYLPPGSQVIVQIVPNQPALGGRNSTLTIFTNTFTFTYGTSKS